MPARDRQSTTTGQADREQADQPKAPAGEVRRLVETITGPHSTPLRTTARSASMRCA